MSDHKAEAEALIPDELHSTFDQTRDYLAIAQVHATLYLAEQQRIANIQTYTARLHENIVSSSVATGDEIAMLAKFTAGIDRLVRDGLGLS